MEHQTVGEDTGFQEKEKGTKGTTQGVARI